MSEHDFEINAYLDHHWHLVTTDSSAPDRVSCTYEMCSDPCIRADSSVLILPAVGPVGSEIRHRLRFPGGATAAQLRAETERVWREGYMAGEHMRRIATADLDSDG